MELCVAQPHFGDPVQRWRWDEATKGTGDTVARVIRHDQEHVRRALEWDHPRRPPRLGILGDILDHAAEFRIRCRELFATNSSRRAGRTGRSSRLALCWDR